MNIKKLLAVISCTFVLIPFAAKIVSSNQVYQLCVNSGIISHYASLSGVLLKMVNKISNDLADIDALKNTSVPVKDKMENTMEKDFSEAVLTVSSTSDKIAKVKDKALLLFTYNGNYSGIVRAEKFSFKEKVFFSSWMLLLITVLLLSVRKSDTDIAAINYFCI
ncbi:MAG: hypothetical protein LBD46_04535 [Endomicrobium sp.]|jgi:hypothetical protein|nr:hypothetical protein [Endomicrobium sp.]